MLLSSALVIADDTLTGEQLYNRCIGCHSFSHHRTGPQHCGLIGRAAGSAADYDYSDAMRESGIIWNTRTLDEFLKSPLIMVPGTSMGFAGIADGAARTRLIQYLFTQASTSECEPSMSQ